MTTSSRIKMLMGRSQMFILVKCLQIQNFQKFPQNRETRHTQPRTITSSSLVAILVKHHEHKGPSSKMQQQFFLAFRSYNLVIKMKQADKCPLLTLTLINLTRQGAAISKFSKLSRISGPIKCCLTYYVEKIKSILIRL